jgi:hypothetical protein
MPSRSVLAVTSHRAATRALLVALCLSLPLVEDKVQTAAVTELLVVQVVALLLQALLELVARLHLQGKVLQVVAHH